MADDQAKHAESGPVRRSSAWRDRLHQIIFEADTPAGKAFDIALIFAILASVAVVVMSTLPGSEDEPVFLILEWIFTLLFTIEYILRLVVVRSRIKYAFSFYGIIDLLAILPAFIGLFMAGGERLLVVRTLRLLRVFRVFKLARYLNEASALWDALVESRHKIAVFLTTVLIVVLIASALMHVVEDESNEAFESIPSAMYWAIITMTTVGYGDITPQTPAGKMITTALVLMGYSLIIVPTGILTAEIAGSSRKPITTRACPHCMAEGHDPDAKFCKRCGGDLHE